MTFNLRDQGRPMETYDPKWNERWDAIHARIQALKQIEGATGTKVQRESELLPQLLAACDAQFQFTWQYDVMQRRHYNNVIEIAKDFEINIESPAYDTSAEEMRQYYAAWSKCVHKLERYTWRKPLLEWESGVFAQQPPRGVTRETFHAVIETRKGPAISANFIAEDHGEVIHVCAVQGPEEGRAFSMDFEEAAEWVAEKYLRQSRLTRLFKPHSKAKFVRFYWTFALFEFDDTDQYVYGVQVTRTRFRNKVLFEKIRVGAATPLLAEAALKLHDDIWPFISNPKHAHLLEKQAARRRKIMARSKA